MPAQQIVSEKGLNSRHPGFLVFGAQAHADFNIYGTIPRACGWGEAHQAPQRRMHVEMYAVRRRHFVGGRIVSVGRSGRCSGLEPGTA